MEKNDINLDGDEILDEEFLEEESDDDELDDKKFLFGKNWIIGQVAERAGFTRGDVRIIFSTFEEVVRDRISEFLNEEHDGEREVVLRLGGIFSIFVSKVQSYRKWNLHTKEFFQTPETNRIIFNPSKRLIKLVKGK